MSLRNQSPIVVERLTVHRPGENAFTANLKDHLKLNVKGAKISQIYKRLDPKKPAYTVTGRWRRRHTCLSLGRTTGVDKQRAGTLADFSR